MKAYQTGRKHRRHLPRGMAARMAAILRQHKAASVQHQGQRKRAAIDTITRGTSLPASYWDRWSVNVHAHEAREDTP